MYSEDSFYILEGFDSADFYLAGESVTCTKNQFRDYQIHTKKKVFSITFDQAKKIEALDKTIGYANVCADNQIDAEAFFFDWLEDDSPNIIAILTVPNGGYID